MPILRVYKHKAEEWLGLFESEAQFWVSTRNELHHTVNRRRGSQSKRFPKRPVHMRQCICEIVRLRVCVCVRACACCVCVRVSVCARV